MVTNTKSSDLGSGLFVWKQLQQNTAVFGVKPTLQLHQ